MSNIMDYVKAARSTVPSCYRKKVRYLVFVAATDFKQALSSGCEAVLTVVLYLTRVIPCTG